MSEAKTSSKIVQSRSKSSATSLQNVPSKSVQVTEDQSESSESSKKSVSRKVEIPKKTAPVESIPIVRTEESGSQKPALKADQYNQWTDRTMMFPVKSTPPPAKQQTPPAVVPKWAQTQEKPAEQKESKAAVDTVNVVRTEDASKTKPALKADQYNQWTDRTMMFPVKSTSPPANQPTPAVIVPKWAQPQEKPAEQKDSKAAVDTVNIVRTEDANKSKPTLKAEQYNQWTDRTMMFPTKTTPPKQPPSTTGQSNQPQPKQTASPPAEESSESSGKSDSRKNK